MEKRGKVEYWLTEDDEWFFHVVAANGRILAHSEGYTTKRKCLQGIVATQKAVNDSRMTYRTVLLTKPKTSMGGERRD